MPVWLKHASLAAAVIIYALHVATGSASRSSPSPEELLARIAEGGVILYVRHAETDAAPEDAGDDDRRLSDSGCADAANLGRAIVALSLPADKVHTSPLPRTRETARQMFSEHDIVDDPVLDLDGYRGDSVDAMIDALRARLGSSDEGANTWLVGHITPLMMALGRHLDDDSFPEGAIAVFEPDGNGGRHLGTLKPGWEAEHVERKQERC